MLQASRFLDACSTYDGIDNGSEQLEPGSQLAAWTMVVSSWSLRGREGGVRTRLCLTVSGVLYQEAEDAGGTPQANRQGLTAQAWDAGRRVQHADISLCGGLGICPL